MRQMTTNGDAAVPRDDVERDVNDMSSEALDELFGCADDPELLQACERGHAAFSQAVLDTSGKRSTDTSRARRVDQPDLSEMSRQRRHRPAPRAGGGVLSLRVGGELKKGARVSGAQRVKLVNDLRKKYERGATIRALAEQTGRSYGFIRRALSEAGIVLRSRDEATRAKKET